MAADSGLDDLPVEQTDEDDSDSEYPIVIQCGRCKAIIGDSVSWVCAKKDLSSITLKKVCENAVVVDDQMVTSKEGPDIGSTYYPIMCSNCQRELGRVYRTTSRDMDDVRDLFTLFVKNIATYQVGSATAQIIDDEKMEEYLTLPDSKYLLFELHKAQAVMLSLSSRLDESQTKISSLTERMKKLEKQTLNGSVPNSSDEDHNVDNRRLSDVTIPMTSNHQPNSNLRRPSEVTASTTAAVHQYDNVRLSNTSNLSSHQSATDGDRQQSAYSETQSLSNISNHVSSSETNTVIPKSMHRNTKRKRN